VFCSSLRGGQRIVRIQIAEIKAADTDFQRRNTIARILRQLRFFYR
jgi:hypothetical protein